MKDRKLPVSVRQAKKMGWHVYRQARFFAVMPDGGSLELPYDACEESAYKWSKRRRKKK